MNPTSILITAAVALPVTAIAAWVWFTLARFDREFRADLKGMHFEI